MINIINEKTAARKLEKFMQGHAITLKHGQALNLLAELAGYRNWATFVAAANQPAVPDHPTIQDVPFEDVHAIQVDGKPFTVVWRNTDVLSKLYSAQEYDEEQGDYVDEDVMALELCYQEDGFTYDDSVSLEVLRSLAWDPVKQLFVGKDGVEYRIFIESEFGVKPVESMPKAEPAPPASNPILDELPVGTEGVLRSIDGTRIVGTQELVYGTAGLNRVVRNADGSIKVTEYDGETDIDWNSQRSVRQQGMMVFQDEEGNTYLEDQVVVTNAA